MRAGDAIEAGAVSRTAGVEAKACTVIFPGGARLTVIGTGLEDGSVTDVAAELSRQLLATPSHAAFLRGALADVIREAPGAGGSVHFEQPEAGVGGGK